MGPDAELTITIHRGGEGRVGPRMHVRRGHRNVAKPWCLEAIPVLGLQRLEEAADVVEVTRRSRPDLRGGDGMEAVVGEGRTAVAVCAAPLSEEDDRTALLLVGEGVQFAAEVAVVGRTDGSRRR